MNKDCHTATVSRCIWRYFPITVALYWQSATEINWDQWLVNATPVLWNCPSTSGDLQMASSHFLHSKRVAESPVKEKKEKREGREGWKGEGQKFGGGDCAHVHVYCLMHTWIKWHSCAWQNEQLQSLQISTNNLSHRHINFSWINVLT